MAGHPPHPFLIRIHKDHLDRAVGIPLESYTKALIGAVKRRVLSQQEAVEIIEDANLHMLEGVSAKPNPKLRGPRQDH